MPTKRFVTYPELSSYGVPNYSRKHLIDLQRLGRFPRARQLTPNRIAWDEADILDWLENRPVAVSVAGTGTGTGIDD